MTVFPTALVAPLHFLKPGSVLMTLPCTYASHSIVICQAHVVIIMISSGLRDERVQQSGRARNVLTTASDASAYQSSPSCRYRTCKRPTNRPTLGQNMGVSSLQHEISCHFCNPKYHTKFDCPTQPTLGLQSDYSLGRLQAASQDVCWTHCEVGRN